MGEAIMYKDLKRNRIGGINGTLDSGVESTLTAEEVVLAESGEWGIIAEYTQAEKDAHKAEQERAELIAQIAALDLPLYTLERALAGDTEAQEKIAANELEKQKLRALLK